METEQKKFKMETKIEIYNKMASKRIIDTMFDAKIFKDSITRDDMQGFEDIVAFELQCQANSSRKIAEFNESWKLKNKK
jgi:hypothetical protein